MRLLIELAIEERWPSGDVTRSEPPRPSVTLPTPRSTEDAKADLEKNNPAAAPPPGAPASQRPMALIPDAPGVFVSGRGRAGAYAIGAGAVGEVGNGDPPKRVVSGLVIKGNVDPTNLVGSATRTIATRVISETML